MLIDEVLPDAHGVAAAPQRQLDQLPIRLHTRWRSACGRRAGARRSPPLPRGAPGRLGTSPPPARPSRWCHPEWIRCAVHQRGGADRNALRRHPTWSTSATCIGGRCSLPRTNRWPRRAASCTTPTRGSHPRPGAGARALGRAARRLVSYPASQATRPGPEPRAGGAQNFRKSGLGLSGTHRPRPCSRLA
jgi:hypothetical protein